MNIKRIILVWILGLLTFNSVFAEKFESKYNFRFQLPDGYQIFNNLNLYDVYNHSNKDPLIKAQINLAKQRLKNQNVELLYNFSSHPLNNINILVFNENYKINKKKVLKQCKKILKIEKKVGKRKVELKECRMHDQPLFADWSMYRENDSSFMEGVITQQIIFLYKKKEYVITSACWEKCDETKADLFNLVKSIKF
jgi:GTPase SAR1 family protein